MCDDEPVPNEPKLYLPGLALTRAMKSFRLPAGNSGLTTSTRYDRQICETGSKSFSGSYGTLAKMAEFWMWVVMPTSTVWPSGADRATISLPIMPLAPALFSTTTFWPQLSCRRAASNRPTRSVAPPGG